MKRTVPILILAMLAAAPGIQAQVKGFGHQYMEHKENVYHRIVHNETESYLYDDAGTFQYLGEVGQSGDGRYFPSGEGVSRSVATNPETGTSKFVYHLGPWKRGSRHGVFLVKLGDGRYCMERWKWNRLKGVLPDGPSADDVARIEEAVTRLESLARISGR